MAAGVLPWLRDWSSEPTATAEASAPWLRDWSPETAMPALADVAEEEAPRSTPAAGRPEYAVAPEDVGARMESDPMRLAQAVSAPQSVEPAPAEPDPFEGEAAGDLLTRRGQQAAAGAAQAVAGVPEAAAVVGRPIALRRRDSAVEAAAGYADEIAKLEQEVGQAGIDPRKATAIRNEIARLGRLRDMAANLAALTTEEGVDRPLSESLGFKAGDAIKQGVEDRVGKPDPADQSFWGQVASGIGNVGGMVAVAVPTAGAAGFASGVGMQGRAMYDEAIAAGADEETAQRAAELGGALGSTEMLPLLRAYKLLPQSIRSKVTNAFLRGALKVAETGGEEAVQEGVSQIAQNLIAQNLYDPERGWNEGALTAAGVGAVVGFGFGGPGAVREAVTEARGTAPSTPPITNAPRPDLPVTPEQIASPIPTPLLQEGQATLDGVAGPAPSALAAFEGRADESPSEALAQPVAALPAEPAVEPDPEPEAAPAPSQAPWLRDWSAASIEDQALLLGAGYSPEDVTDMNAAEIAAEVAQAREQGVQPVPVEEAQARLAGVRSETAAEITPEVSASAVEPAAPTATVPEQAVAAPIPEQPVPNGMVRMYHGTPGADGQPADAGGERWFSSSRRYARDYRGGGDEGLWYVDVPRSDPMFDADYEDQSVDRGFTVNTSFDPAQYGGARPVVPRPAQPVSEPVAASPVAASQSAPEAPAPVSAPAPRASRGKAPKVQKKPFTYRIKSLGIDPKSPAAAELAHAGITPRNTPGLFRRGGLKDVDNLPAQEWQDVAHEVGIDGDYLSRQGVIDALVREHGGEPVRNAEQMGAAAEADAVEDRARRLDTANAFIENRSFKLSDAERDRLAERIADSDADPDDVVERFLIHEVDRAEEPSDEARDIIPGWDDEPSGSVRGAVEAGGRGAGRSEGEPDAEEAGTPGGAQHPGRARDEARPLEPKVQTLAQFAHERGLTTTADVDSHIHAGLRSKPETKTFDRGYRKRLDQLQNERDETRRLYEAEIASGRIRDLTPEENLRGAAAGHPDLPSTAAAQRVLAKREARKAEAERQRTGTREGGAIDITPEGDQRVIEGAEKIPDRERAERAQAAPKRGGDKPMQDDGLFGDPGNRGDLFDAPFAKARDDGRRTVAPNLDARIDDAIAGRRRAEPIVVGKTPEVLVALGAPDDPVIIAPGVVDKALQKHRLTAEQLKAALRGIYDPAIVFDSAPQSDAPANSFVVAVEVRRADGAPITVALHLDRTIGKTRITNVASVNARRPSQIRLWMDEGLARFVGKGAGRWLSLLGLQLPRAVVQHRQGKKVLHHADVFKPQVKERRSTPGGRVAYEPTPEFDAKAQAVALRLQRRLDSLGLPGLKLGVVDRLFARGADGTLTELDGLANPDTGVIAVALTSTRGADVTLGHEALHALKGAGLFRDAEWRALERMARADTDRMARAREEYPELSEAGQVEEVIADQFGEWWAGRMAEAPKGFVRSGYERLRAFLRALGAALRGEGFTTPESVFRGIERGGVGSRRPAPGAGRSFGSTSNMPAATDKAPADVLASDAEDFAELAIANSLIVKGFGSLDVKAGHDVLAVMRRLLENDEVLRSVVSLISIDVVDVLAGEKLSAKDLLNDPAVLIDLLAVDTDNSVPGSVQAVDTLARYVALAAAEGPLAGTDQARGLLVDLAAGEAGKGDLRVAHDSSKIPEPSGKGNDSLVSISRKYAKARPAGVERIEQANRASLPEETRGQYVWRQIKDDKARLKQAQALVAEMSGAPVPEHLDAYLAAALYQTKSAADLRAYQEGPVKALMAEVKRAIKETGATASDIDAYLIAKHAPERNAEMAKRGNKGGSGMTDAEAQAIIDDAKAKGRAAAFNRVAMKVRAMLKADIEHRVAAGLISRETADAWAAMYRNYVPLRGFAERADDDPDPQIGAMRTGRGFDVRGPESRRAEGRTSAADSPIAYTVMMGSEGIIRAGKNRVAKTLYRFAKEHPTDLAEAIGKVPVKVARDLKTGEDALIINEAELRAANILAAKIGGKPYYVRLSPEIAVGMKNLGVNQLSQISQAARKLTRFWSSMLTSRNPAFFIPNATVDFMTGILSAMSGSEKGMTRRYLTSYLHAMRVLWQWNATGKLSAKDRALFDEWHEAGGRMDFYGFESLDDIKAKIGVSAGDKSIGAKISRASRKVGIPQTFEAIEWLNFPFENAARFASYIAARKLGVSRAKAALHSLESTGNFASRGEMTPLIGAWYPFFNASMTGLQQLGRFASKRQTQAVLGGAVIFPMAWAIASSLAYPGDDDDPEGIPLYFRIPEWERGRSLIIPRGVTEVEITNPDGSVRLAKRLDYATVRIPHALRPFWNLGDKLAQFWFGGVRVGEVVRSTIDSVLFNWNPVSGGDLVSMALPLPLDPVYELSSNRDGLGREIRPEGFGGEGTGVPAYSWQTGQTGPAFIEIAKGLNTATGGNSVTPGALSIHPDRLEYLWEFLVGGLGRFANETYQVGANLAAGVPTPPNRWPILRTVVGQTTASEQTGAFYDMLGEGEDMATRMNNVKRLVAQGQFAVDGPEWQEVLQLADQLGAVVTAPDKDVKWKGSWVRVLRKARDKTNAIRDEEITPTMAREDIPRAEVEKLVEEMRGRQEAIRLEARTKALEMRAAAPMP